MLFNRSYIHLLATLLSFAFWFCSCGSEDQIKDPLVLSPDSGTIYNLDAEGDMVKVSFSAKSTWTAQLSEVSDSEWVSILPSSGSAGDKTILVQCEPNLSGVERAAKVKIVCESTSIVLTFRQKQMSAITLSSSRIDLGPEGGEFNIALKTNVEFSYVIEGDAKEWISYLSTKSYETRTLSFTALQNEELSKRTGTITFTGGGKKESIKIVQEAAYPAIVVDGKERFVSAAGGVISVEVASNVDVNVKIPTAASVWVHQVDTKGMSTSNISFEVTENNDVESRSARIAFTNAVNGVSDTLIITQMYRDALVVSPSVIEADGNGDMVSVAVGHNVSFSVAVDRDWIRQVETKSYRTDSLYFEVLPNDGYEVRTADISFISADKTIRQDIIVNQNHTKTFSFSPGLQTVSSEGGIVEIRLDHNVPVGHVDTDALWIKLIREMSTDTETVYLYEVEENLSYGERCATVSAVDASGHLYASTEIVQIQNEGLIVDIDSLSFGWQSQEKELMVSTNVGAIVKVPAYIDWLRCEYISTKALEDEQILLILDANYTTEERSAELTITDALGKGFSHTIIVSQGPRTIAVDMEPEAFMSIRGDHVKLSFTAYGDWYVNHASSGMLTFSENSGQAGDIELDVMVNISNNTNAYQIIEEEIVCDGYPQTVRFSQAPSFFLSATEYNIPSFGGERSIPFEMTIPAGSHVILEGDGDFEMMINASRPPSGISGGSMNRSAIEEVSATVNLSVYPNYTNVQRVGRFRLVSEVNGERAESAWCTVSQDFGGYSTDYSQDGRVTVLQSHSRGAGVPIVILGDAFNDEDVSSGAYDRAMREAYGYLFTKQPMTTLRDLFDVYYVTAVSPTREFNGQTRFQTWFGGGTSVGGDDDYCARYAREAVGDIDFDDLTILVVLNTRLYAGTCWMYYGEGGDASGMSVAYVPMTDPNAYWMGFEEVLHHEAVGHGFGKLADEYWYEGTIPLSEKESLRDHHKIGMFRNVDLTSDVDMTLWTQFAHDARFSEEHLGAYEGAYTYSKGVYRPTETSIMVDNTGVFNAPSRGLIYKRAMSIAYRHEGWTFDYDSFVDFDMNNRDALSPAASASGFNGFNPVFVPLSSPVVVKKPFRLDE